MGLTKLQVETQLTCGPKEAPGRNKDAWSFTCEPNEAPGRNEIGLLPVGLTKLLVKAKLCGLLLVGPFTSGPYEAPGKSQVVWSFTCGPNEAPSRSLVTWPWVFVVLCF